MRLEGAVFPWLTLPEVSTLSQRGWPLWEGVQTQVNKYCYGAGSWMTLLELPAALTVYSLRSCWDIGYGDAQVKREEGQGRY